MVSVIVSAIGYLTWFGRSRRNEAFGRLDEVDVDPLDPSVVDRLAALLRLEDESVGDPLLPRSKRGARRCRVHDVLGGIESRGLQRDEALLPQQPSVAIESRLEVLQDPARLTVAARPDLERDEAFVA